MRRLLIPMLLPVVMLWQSCGSTQLMTKLNEIADDGKVLAKGIRDLPGKVETKVNEATAKFRDLGAPVDGTAGDMALWAAQNPGKVASGGFGAFALALAGAWWRSRKARPVQKAFHAVVDTFEAAPDTATKADLLAQLSAHPQMDGEARAAVSIAKSR